MSQKSRISLSQSIALQAPLEKGDHVDIEELIEASKQAEAQRQRRVEFETQISVAVAKKRAQQGRKNAAERDNSPTPERVAKLAEQERDVTAITPPIKDKDTRALTKTYMVQAPLERYKAHLRPGLEETARRLLNVFLLADTGPRVTSSYEGMTTAGVPSARSGGVQDHVRWATAMARVIETEWPVEFVEAKDWLLTQVVIKQSGAAMKFEDIGQKMGLPWKSPDTHKGAGFGRFIDMLIIAERFFARQDATGWADPPSAAATQALQSELRARAQVRREMEMKRQARIKGS